MPFCRTSSGATFPIPPGQSCPAGSTLVTTQDGQATGSSNNGSSVTPSVSNYTSNQDTRPVKVGYAPTASYSGGIPGPVGDATTIVAEAQGDFNKIYGAAHAASATKKERNQYKIFVEALRNYTGSELGTRGSVEQAWHDVLKDAASSGRNAYELLYGGSSSNSSGSSSRSFGGGSYGGGGGAAAPTVSGQQMQRAADQAMQQYTGREATQAEGRTLTRQVRRGLASDPTNTDPTYMAEQFAKNTPGATEYAANNYMKVFLQSLGGLGG